MFVEVDKTSDRFRGGAQSEVRGNEIKKRKKDYLATAPEVL
jgi:hypothetical protein